MASIKYTHLYARWSKKENAILYHHPDNKSNGGFLAGWFENEIVFKNFGGTRNFVQELEARGFDPKTLKFSIAKKKT